MNLALIPEPHEIRSEPGTYAMPHKGAIAIDHPSLITVAEIIRGFFPRYLIRAAVDGISDPIRVLLRSKGIREQGYTLSISDKGVTIEASSPAGAFYAAQTLAQIARQSPRGELPRLAINDWPDFPDRGVYYDVCRGRVPALDSLSRQARTLAHYKINQYQLYVEHTFQFRAHPLIGRGASPLTADDIISLDRVCRECLIEFVPSLASFGHLSTVLRHPPYRKLAEDWGVGRYVAPEAASMPAWQKHPAWSLSPANPEIYGFLDSLYREFLPLFSSSRFNVCCDETWDLGLGQSYELCRKRGKGRVYLDHIIRLRELSARYGKTIMFWGDIIRHYPELIPHIPRDVLVLDWGYAFNHPFDRISDFRKAGLRFYACPGTSSWVSLFPRLHEACANIHGFSKAGAENGASGVLNTDWGDGGHYNFMEYSWHGYLFGAEQSWNVGADRSTFTRRFVRLFLNSGSQEVARAIDRLGDIAHLNVDGFYQSAWRHILFAAPDSSLFDGNPKEAWTCDAGRISHRRIRLDAKRARETLDCLSDIRRAFSEAQAQKGADPHGVLPYWIFAVDTISAAARKLAALAPDGRGSSTARKEIRRELASLRERFIRLWMARNRRSEIAITLKLYSDAIESLR